MPTSDVTRADAFRIQALAKDGPVCEARMRRPSAVVLAMKWEALGYSNVTITDPAGEAYALADFRAQHVPSMIPGAPK